MKERGRTVIRIAPLVIIALCWGYTGAFRWSVNPRFAMLTARAAASARLKWRSRFAAVTQSLRLCWAGVIKYRVTIPSLSKPTHG
jgi:hypothetical protein